MKNEETNFLKEIHLYINSFINKGICIEYFMWLKANGKLFTRIETTHELFSESLLTKCKQHECFQNSKQITIKNKNINYYEGIASVYGSFYEHAWNEHKGAVLDFTCKQFNLTHHISYLFGAPILFYSNKEYLSNTKRTSENDLIFQTNNPNYFYLKQTINNI